MELFIPSLKQIIDIHYSTLNYTISKNPLAARHSGTSQQGVFLINFY